MTAHDKRQQQSISSVGSFSGLVEYFRSKSHANNAFFLFPSPPWILGDTCLSLYKNHINAFTASPMKRFDCHLERLLFCRPKTCFFTCDIFSSRPSLNVLPWARPDSNAMWLYTISLRLSSVCYIASAVCLLKSLHRSTGSLLSLFRPLLSRRPLFFFFFPLPSKMPPSGISGKSSFWAPTHPTRPAPPASGGRATAAATSSQSRGSPARCPR